MGAMEKALKDLDGLGERAVRTRILGIKDEDEPEQATEEAPAATAEEGEPELDDDTRKKLEELLSQ